MPQMSFRTSEEGDLGILLPHGVGRVRLLFSNRWFQRGRLRSFFLLNRGFRRWPGKTKSLDFLGIKT